ncbi:hypothetical protein AtubIFM57258_003165 [Aspergillus tubingensis]|nr:hypothetical protein AtubIFM57258_003165 [Aspergillus tubingensis]
MPMAPPISGTSVDIAMRDLASRFDSGVPRLRVEKYFYYKVSIDHNMFLPPEEPYDGYSSTLKPKALRGNSSFTILKLFLQHFVFLSANNLLSESQIHKVVEYIVEKGGTIILLFICRLRSPLMAVFARKVFHNALLYGNIYLSRKFIQCGFWLQTDTSPSRHQTWTEYLCHAVYSGNEAMVELLCRAGVRPEIEFFFRRPNYWDLKVQVLPTLFAFGADPEKYIKDRETGFPLIDAARSGSLKAVKLLQSKGARVNLYLARYCGTALQAAASRGHLEVAEYLVQHGADINVPCVQQIQLPGYYNYEVLISLLTPVQIAAMVDNVSFLRYLLQHGASAMAFPASAVSPQTDLEVYHPRHTSKIFVCTALQYGVSNQNMEIILLLLNARASPDSRAAPNIGDTPLQMAARLGNVEIYRLLCSWGADINAPPAVYNGRTALQGAAESGNLEILRMLLEADAQVNAPAGAEKGLTALQAACLNGHYLMAGFLLAKGADLNVDPSPVGGLTPIQAAASYGDIRLVRDLIALGAEVDAPPAKEGKTALQAAAKHKSLPLLELLVQHGADVNIIGAYDDMHSPLAIAADQDWLEGMRFFLDRGARINCSLQVPIAQDGTVEYHLARNFCLLDWAVLNGNEEMTRLLLQHGANSVAPPVICPYSYQSLLWLSLRERFGFDIIDLLLAKVPDFHKHPGSADTLKLTFTWKVDIAYSRQILERLNMILPSLCHRAVQRAWDRVFKFCGKEKELKDVIEFLLESGANINSRAEDGSTLLQRAARYGHEKPCILLIDHGAAVNIHATRSYGTPLQEVIRRHHFNLAILLLNRGADVNALPALEGGTTALQAAAISGMLKLAVLLLERGADVTAPAAQICGRTAIDLAAEYGHFDMVQLFLNAYGEDADLESIRRQAAGFARREGHHELADWLLSRWSY